MGSARLPHQPERPRRAQGPGARAGRQVLDDAGEARRRQGGRRGGVDGRRRRVREGARRRAVGNGVGALPRVRRQGSSHARGLGEDARSAVHLHACRRRDRPDDGPPGRQEDRPRRRQHRRRVAQVGRRVLELGRQGVDAGVDDVAQLPADCGAACDGSRRRRSSTPATRCCTTPRTSWASCCGVRSGTRGSTRGWRTTTRCAFRTRRARAALSRPPADEYARVAGAGQTPDWELSEMWREYLRRMVKGKSDTELRKLMGTDLSALTLADGVKSWAVVTYFMEKRRDEFIELLKRLRAEPDADPRGRRPGGVRRGPSRRSTRRGGSTRSARTETDERTSAGQRTSAGSRAAKPAHRTGRALRSAALRAAFDSRAARVPLPARLLARDAQVDAACVDLHGHVRPCARRPRRRVPAPGDQASLEASLAGHDGDGRAVLAGHEEPKALLGARRSEPREDRVLVGRLAPSGGRRGSRGAFRTCSGSPLSAAGRRPAARGSERQGSSRLGGARRVTVPPCASSDTSWTWRGRTPTSIDGRWRRGSRRRRCRGT